MKRIKIAYLLLAHKNPEQINLFINQLLSYGDCDIYIHVDKKAQTIIPQITQSENVFIISRYSVSWGSFEICKAAVELMGMALQSGREYSHFYFGSGQDLLVRKGLYEFLENEPDSIYIRIDREITDSSRESARYRICWPRKLMIRNDLHPYRFVRIALQLLCKVGIVIHKNTKKLKVRIHFYEGRTWFVAPTEVIEYILKYLKQHKDYYYFWEDSLASDLMFFQTIIMNSPYANKVRDELMFVQFGNNFCTMNHPLEVTKECEYLIEKGNFYFARKFDLEKDRSSFEYYLGSVNK